MNHRLRGFGLWLPCALAWVTQVAVAGGPAPPPVLQHLEPGGRVEIVLDLPVTVVFVGLEEGPPPTGIDPAALIAAQPTVVRPREWRAHRAGEPAGVGIEYRCRTRVVFADRSFEDAFFGFLGGAGIGPLAPTPVQAIYSSRPRAAARIDRNLVLDATEVESWLLENARTLLGVDTARPTVFFINWHGRRDFQFHTYTHFTYQPEVDLFAPHWTINHTIAWGGGVPDVPQSPTRQLGRVWFMDVSAGPELHTFNFDLELADVDADGIDDYRIPPVWEYGTSHGFRPFDDLGRDLAAVVRYVAINFLFAPGPLYDAGLSAPRIDDVLELDLNLFVREPHNGPTQGLVPAEILRRLAALDPSRSFRLDLDVHAFTPALERAYQCASAPATDPKVCQPGNQAHGDPYKNTALALLIWATDHENQYLDGVHGEVPIALFDVDREHYVPYLGVAFNQQWNLLWDTPVTRASRRSPTYLAQHEVGHHLGLRHPSDGFDVDRRDGFMASGDFFFARLGDETATAMSLLGSGFGRGALRGQVDFSQFDRDNLDRWLTAARLQAANDILADVYASPRASRAEAELAAADALAGRALARLRQWDLRGASLASRDAYGAVVAAAAKAGVQVEPRSATAQRQSAGPWWFADDVADRPGAQGLEPLESMPADARPGRQP